MRNENETKTTTAESQNLHRVHPYAASFPSMRSDQILSLAEDIKEKGLIHPVVMYDGAILDGRARYLACYAAGIVPETVSVPKTKDPLDALLSENAHRKHLTPSQLAASAVLYELTDIAWLEDKRRRMEVANQSRSEKQKKNHARDIDNSVEAAESEGEEPRRNLTSDQLLGKLFSVSDRLIRDARTILEADGKLPKDKPALFPQIHDGRRTVNNAMGEVERSQADDERRSLRKSTSNKGKKGKKGKRGKKSSERLLTSGPEWAQHEDFESHLGLVIQRYLQLVIAESGEDPRCGPMEQLADLFRDTPWVATLLQRAESARGNRNARMSKTEDGSSPSRISDQEAGS